MKEGRKVEGEAARKEEGTEMPRVLSKAKAQGRKKRHAPGNDASLPNRSSVLGRTGLRNGNVKQRYQYKDVRDRIPKHESRKKWKLKRSRE